MTISQRKGKQRAGKVLIIDAEPVRAKKLAEALREEGFRAVTCRPAQGVLGRLKREKPDAVILEVILPSKSGFEIAARMQADRNLSLVPVFFTTDIQDSGGGNHDYFCRPLELPRLVRILRERIGI